MKKIFCPYCGNEMLFSKGEGYRMFQCGKCCATSPFLFGFNDDEKKARAIIFSHYKKLRNPLTLEEALKQSAVWIEWLNNIYNTEPCIINECGQDSVIIDYANDYQDYATKDRYGALWRCWASKPTDEEMAAARWKD